MRLLLSVTAALVLAAGLGVYTPRAEAARIVVGVGLPGFAVVAPAPVFAAPPLYYYGPRPYGYVAGPPLTGFRPHYYGFYGRAYYGHRGWR
jgi:hypothetical protein